MEKSTIEKNVEKKSEVGGKFYKKFTKFLNNGGGYALFIIAVVAIVFATIGFHGQHKFNIWWFIFFELPLYIFCGWALWRALKIYQGRK